MAVVFAFVLTAFFATANLLAQDGAELYRRHCASCHDASAQSRAPGPDALRRLTPERILHALESIANPMSTQGRARTAAERRSLALYLSGKPFETEEAVDLRRVGCKSPSNFLESVSGPSWNGWSTDVSNTRFQSAEAAGMDASKVPRLKPKWVFAYPGDIMAYSQATIVGSRVFIGS